MIKITNQRPKWLTNNFIKWFAIGIVAVLVTGYIIFEALSLGNVQYLIKSQQCGSKPVTLELRTLPLGGEIPEYIIDSTPGWFDEKAGLSRLYCSVDEAKTAQTGYNKFEVK